ncbi:hypothetical protein G5V58_22745 [Nocardioides anomalus]|uniref:Carboxypeptidase regulatory-like domain-containing protein n=1 Tax=Nocardioides anomalus TaxID=2712223 RepID=A0A6G6WJ72_9ACTN|nr:hypothetical protein [Nocardioides anomalus]QIG45207.1 hypothetical protein G5V58_22745 [Nocardioides anomalus]
MAERTDDELLAGVRAFWEGTDPVPDGLVARVQAAAALAASDRFDVGLDLELMLLVERTEELAGTRGSGAAAYTLRFARDGVDLLLRISADGTAARIDGWVVPPSPVAVTVQRDTDTTWHDVATIEVDATGRFELAALTAGMLRLRLEPNDGSTPFQTPAFEI